MKGKSDLFVITKSKDLAKYIFTITEKSPKKYRFSLVVRMQNYILDIIENLYLANKSRDDSRLSYQIKSKDLLSMLDYFSNISYEVGCILYHQYEVISKTISECLLYLNKWINSAKVVLKD